MEAAAGEIAFETRDFYLACFLRCTGYESARTFATKGGARSSFSRTAPPDGTT